jgi:hypothetical protein
LPQIGHVAVTPDGSGTRNVAQPLVLQNIRLAAERRRRRWAAVRTLMLTAWLGERDNISISFRAWPAVIGAGTSPLLGSMRSTILPGSERSSLATARTWELRI